MNQTWKFVVCPNNLQVDTSTTMRMPPLLPHPSRERGKPRHDSIIV